VERTTDPLVEHLFRTEAGKLVATLTRIFGTANIQLAEDVVQETLIAALSHWGVSGVPDNPAGWLMQVAKRKVLNELKRNKRIQRDPHTDFVSASSYEIDELFADGEIRDSQLRMMFTCCHPSLNTESQISLTLKTLCGFGITEVARALLTNEVTINKRLYRAKKTIRESNLPFDIPAGNDLEKRLESVCLTLYLMYNEGYNSSGTESIIKKELCLEAMRLTQLLVDYFKESNKVSALLSLMCFHTARFNARIDDKGAIIIFEHQNRELWNKELIALGVIHLNNASRGEKLSAYHLEAGIAAEHCLAKSFEETDWKSIYNQYELLFKLKPNPLITLNLAIIKSKLDGERESLRMLEKLAKTPELSNYYLLWATQGVFSLKLKEYSKATEYFQKAIGLTNSKTEVDFLERKLREAIAASQ
jgi:RNA polymerase sigma factor (sigma-70 family)